MMKRPPRSVLANHSTTFHNLVVREDRMVIQVNPKCGWQSANAYLSKVAEGKAVETVSPDEVKELKKQRFRTLAIVRNPLDRLASCWQKNLRDQGPVGNMKFWYDECPPWEVFLMDVCACPDGRSNIHWRSQTVGLGWVCPPQGTAIVDILLASDVIADFPHDGASESSPPKVPTEMLAPLVNRYLNDFAMLASLSAMAEHYGVEVEPDGCQVIKATGCEQH